MSDQQYLYGIHIAISRDKFSSDLTFKTPGPVVHSRWLTTSGRILRVYVAIENPSESFILFLQLIL